MNPQSLHTCLQWAANTPEIRPDQLQSLLKRHDGKTAVAAMLDLLPEDLQAEYAGALHLQVSGEWSIHPASAFKTINAPADVMVEVLVNLLLAHPECRPTPPKALALASGPATTGSEGASAATTPPASPEASEG